ncbi:phosphatidylserine/phosphatidylglycerophosphate/cardiolipin synthase family protein [Cellulosimicrobium arenosum]|uniref:Phosphatidylserine/phosphatidylglycerophosphate/ cardiolipin synthase family protein n=1 Tax=Cellulosimicrobium arenosum TaxID=2708133 RepID=A0A927G6I9_9MICO|nr:phospholipase D-like domain-containing protein [Cellulosimicrobium arenosum]MBD8077834.1 phosphatidylserine/phosphatidylglycerophosphate/cardiolipin synthase family protein [Cellulosimicrobium arenosum]
MFSDATWRNARRIASRALVVTVAAPLAVAAVLVAADTLRKRRNTAEPTFPHGPPVSAELVRTTTTLYTYGEDLYRDMLAAIQGAEQCILLETYIWKSDEVGNQFKDALVAASERGVQVFVIYDGFANLVVPRTFFDLPEPIQVIRYPVFRPGILMLNVRKSGRDHRKILVVDDEIGFVGGYNIATLYATQWRDTHVRLEGPSTWELRNAFVDFWNNNRAPDQPLLQDPGSVHWEPRLRAARNAPAHLVFPIRGMYLDAIDRASSHIYITQAYFIPDREILAALLMAAARGVDVRVLVPERSNHVLADWLARGLYTALLRGGVRIHLYQNAMVHAKTATIDGRWTTIGTANIDRLSLTGNYEVNLEITDDTVAQQMQDVYDVDLSNSRELTLEEWSGRSVVAKLSEITLRPLRPLL